MTELTVYVRKEGHVGVVTLSRPSRLNAFTFTMLTELLAVLETLTRDAGVRAIILTGAGKAFCAGQDLSERDPRGRTEPFDLAAIQRSAYHPILRLLRETTKPVLCAVNGVAAGAGAGIALAADIVLMKRSASFLFSFIKVGLSVDAGLGFALVHSLGPARARALMMRGGIIGAEQAEYLGLVAECVDDDAFEERAAAIARELAASPVTALAGIKRAVEAAQTAADYAGYLEMEADLQGYAGHDPDYTEGVLAFLEKRAPKWRGLV
jgi:2-(1,2-epoxy-1,2-dihydrophenyl)acetyl-CoA isomerase